VHFTLIKFYLKMKRIIIRDIEIEGRYLIELLLIKINVQT